jgi:hypothetical protein
MIPDGSEGRGLTRAKLGVSVEYGATIKVKWTGYDEYLCCGVVRGSEALGAYDETEEVIGGGDVDWASL